MKQQIIFIDGLIDSTKYLFAKHLSEILDLPIISVYDGLSKREIEPAYFDHNYVQEGLIKLIQEQSLSCIITDFCLSRSVFAVFSKVFFDFNLAKVVNNVFATQFNAKLLYFDVSFKRLQSNNAAKRGVDFTFNELLKQQELYNFFLAQTCLPFIKVVSSGNAINVAEICNFINRGDKK